MSLAAQVDEWSGEDVSIPDVERALAALRRRCGEDESLDLRTSVLTHVAWVPPEWHEAAEQVLEGLAERHPSRAIVLYPQPDETASQIDARASVEAFSLPGLEQHVAAEVIRLTIRGDRCRAPASIVLPLLLPDLPVFLRWRGPLPFGAHTLEQLVGIADRLIVDSTEWSVADRAWGRLPELFESIAVSDIAWARTLDWRRAIAALWPDVAGASRLSARGPYAEGWLLAGWLTSRLGHPVALEHEDAPELRAIAVDGHPVEVSEQEQASPADLLSEELERFGRDRVYEAAVSGLTGRAR